MRGLSIAGCLFVLGCGGPSFVERPPPAALDTIGWMRGVWQARTETGAATVELWTPTGADTWMGLGRTVEDGRVTHHEVLRMERHADGVRYVAAPAGQARTAFALTRASEASARFENPDHDFPTWITYERSQRTMTASIGGRGSDTPRASWRFEREGDAPPLLDLAGRLCRDGGRLAVALEGCHCGGAVYCAGFDVEGGIDVHLALSEDDCDACEPLRAECAIPDRPVQRVNGRALAEDERRCVGAALPVLVAP
ncbi:MAG: hypothetical protein KF729_34800 [Sandaracinaceae bacterium]|nr:hypothetical protein [Sandaracinaceae bacterium]